MIGKRHVVAIASVLSFAAHAAEPAARLKPASCGTPAYTTEWRNDELQGTVRLAVLVDADGSVKQARVVESSGHRALDKASLRASYTCKFGTAVGKDAGGTAGWSTVQYKWITD